MISLFTLRLNQSPLTLVQVVGVTDDSLDARVSWAPQVSVFRDNGRERSFQGNFELHFPGLAAPTTSSCAVLSAESMHALP